jgi:agmatine deiminase
MPAEWEPHEATWLAWPHNPDDWPGKFQAIPWLYAEIVRLLAAHERCIFSSRTPKPSSACGILERAGANLDRVSFHLWPTNRSWTRDSGPIFLRNAEGKSRPHQLALQRLGQVRRLAARRSGAGARDRSYSACPNGSLRFG